jgi:hypothetical protein
VIVYVNKTRSDHHATGIDHSSGLGICKLSDRDNPVTVDRDVSSYRFLSGSIDNFTTSHNQVKRHVLASCLKSPP